MAQEMRKNETMKFKTLIILSGLGFMLASTLIMVWTFLGAYLSPPNYSIIVSVNNYNEANAEFIMLLFFVPVCIYSTIKLIQLRRLE